MHVKKIEDNSELILQYKSCYEQMRMGRIKRSVPERTLAVFKGQYNFITLNLPFTYIALFPSEYFEHQPKVTLSFKTEQYCTHV